MRVAALYDIHGNIEALDAVLQELGSEAVDLIVIGGDIAWGAFPAEAIQRVRSLKERHLVIRGNADREVATPPPTAEPSWIDEVTEWCHNQLSPSEKAFLGSLPLTRTLGSDPDEVLFCHGTPRSDEEIFTAITPDEEVAKILDGLDAKLIVCGHTHTQFDRSIHDYRVVNAGSIGMPYEDEPGAYWAIIGEDVELRRTAYDFERATERMRGSGCPYSEEFATAVTSPLSRDEAVNGFEQARSSRS